MFEDILVAAGYRPIELRHDAKHWQWWVASFANPVRSYEEDFVYFDKKARWRDVEAVGQYFTFGHPDKDVTIILSNAARPLVRDLQRVKAKVTQNSSLILTVPAFLNRALQTTLYGTGDETVELAGLEHFISPSIHFAADAERSDGVARLTRWFDETNPSDPNVGVLLAHGGTGKSTLALALFGQATARRDDRIPLLVRQAQWAGIVNQDWTTLADVWREAISEWFPGAVFGPQTLEVCLSQGAIIPIFDGFDELSTYLPAFSPSETLEEMLATFSEGRVLLTSRRRFWEENVPPALRKEVVEIDLHPFDAKQTGAYLARRFPDSPERRRRARSVLDRLAGKTLPSIRDGGHHSERLDRLPLVVMLIAESADSEDDASDFGELLDREDPLRAVLEAFCRRERGRQKLDLSADAQLRTLEVLANEFGDTFGDDDVKLALMAGEGTLPLEQIRRFLEHTLLQRDGDRTRFRFPFVRDYLVASIITRALSGATGGSDLAQGLGHCASGRGNVIELVADLMRSREGGESSWITWVRSQWKAGLPTPVAEAGLFHVAARLARDTSQGSRAAATALLVEACDPRGEGVLRGIRLEGAIVGLDFCDIRFTRCTLQDVEFRECSFSEGSHFERCSFVGRLTIDHCDGIDLARIDESCQFDPGARSALQAARKRHTSTVIRVEQVDDAILSVLRRFRRANIYRTRQREGVRSSVKKAIPFGEVLLDILERAGTLETVGKHGEYYGVKDKHAAHNFHENRIVTGSLREARQQMIEKVGALDVMS